jgi:hypothetical protein
LPPWGYNYGDEVVGWWGLQLLFVISFVLTGKSKSNIVVPIYKWQWMNDDDVCKEKMPTRPRGFQIISQFYEELLFSIICRRKWDLSKLKLCYSSIVRLAAHANNKTKVVDIWLVKEYVFAINCRNLCLTSVVMLMDIRFVRNMIFSSIGRTECGAFAVVVS